LNRQNPHKWVNFQSAATADPNMRMGDGSTDRTYAQYARDLRIGDLLEDALRRNAPRSPGQGR
jgi:hypothetical protein